MFKVKDKDTRTMSPERRHCGHSCVFIVNFDFMSHLFYIGWSDIFWDYTDLKKVKKTCKTCSIPLFHKSPLKYMEKCKYDSKRTKKLCHVVS